MKCDNCGKEYQKVYKNLYCSDPCRKAKLLEKHRIRNGITAKNKKCVVCGMDFITYDDHHKTCTEECSKINKENLRVAYYQKNAERYIKYQKEYQKNYKLLSI